MNRTSAPTALQTVLETYNDHPNRDHRLVARKMGWDWLEEALDAAEKGTPESGHENPDARSARPLEPNPLTDREST